MDLLKNWDTSCQLMLFVKGQGNLDSGKLIRADCQICLKAARDCKKANKKVWSVTVVDPRKIGYAMPSFWLLLSTDVTKS